MWYMEFLISVKQTVSQKERGTFLRHALENVTNCPSAVQFLPAGCLWKWNLAVNFVNFDHV